MNGLRPIHYKVCLEPDLTRFLFSGQVEILLDAAEPADRIALNVLDLAVGRCELKSGENPAECAFCVHPEKETLEIVLPEARKGEFLVSIDFTGAINDKMSGFYRSFFHHEGRQEVIAVTQFEESHARMAFPCMDHPRFKATFDIEMVVDRDLTAISNGPILEETTVDDGKKRVRFQRTPIMSTYLLFFGVGRFEFIEDDSEKTLVRVAAIPEAKQYGAFGLDFGRKSLTYCEDYYKIPYPLPKMDLIAIPDFAFGAMENWGAITFRENLLLHYPGVTSKAAEVRICEVIAHEIVHQWFGNLVSPSDWKYLWLNESFATYFGFGIVDHYHPEWHTWDQFIHEQTDTALSRDAHHETVSIEIPGGEHVVINASTAPIIYNKGGSILKQIEGYIGRDGFQKGLRNYLEKFQYQCAESNHLWEALEEASDTPIQDIMKSWVEQPGHPLVEGDKTKDGLVLTQKRFTCLPNDFDQTWLIPVAITLFDDMGKQRTVKVLLDEKQKTVPVEGKANIVAYKINAGQTGFYRVHYKDKSNLHALGGKVRSKELPPEDRWGLQNDLFAMVRSGAVPLDEGLDFLGYYEREDAYLPLVGIASNLYRMYLVTKNPCKAKIASMGRTFLERKLTEMGFESGDGEPPATAALREQMLTQAAIYGSGKALSFGTEQFKTLLDGGTIPPDIKRSVMQIGAMNGDENVFAFLDRIFETAEAEHERINALWAIGSFKDESCIRTALRHVLEKTPARNKFVPITALCINPNAIPYMWDWFVSNREAIEAFHPMQYERVVEAVVPVCALDREDEAKRFFEERMKRTETAADTIRLTLEKLEINRRLRER